MAQRVKKRQKTMEDISSSSGRFKALRKKIRVTPEVFVLLTVMFYEIFLYFSTLNHFSFGTFLGIVFLSLFTGLFFGFFCLLFKKHRTRRAVAIAVTSYYGVIVLVEYFVNAFFQNFMPFSSIFSGAGDVVGNFSDNIFSTVFGGLWCIILFALPILFFAFFTDNSEPKRRINFKILRKRWLCFLAVLLVIDTVLVTLISSDKNKLRKEYEFDSAVRSFGLALSLNLDVVNGLFPPAIEIDSVIPSEDDYENNPDKEPEITYDYNVSDIDFAALAQNTGNSSLKSIHEYIASVKPSKQNEYTGLFKGKNLILISAEAFSAEVIDKDLTPTLYRLANKGIKFTDYYQPAWGGSTSTGEYSNIIGLIPTNGVNSIKQTAGHNMYYTMGNQLMRLGYFSRAYHNNTYTYYGRNLTHENLGYSKFIAKGNGMEAGINANIWPQSDLEMMDFTVSQYIDKQPFSVYYMTVSGHANYSLTGNMMSYKNYDVVKDLPKTEEVKCYLAANMELEYAMASLVKQLEDAGIADDTVIVLGTDHYPYGLSNVGDLYGYPADDCFKRDHSALIIWSGCIEDKNIVVDTPTYSLDIVPTLSNLFGTEYDSRLLVGRDVFSDQIPLVIWANYSWKTDKGQYDSSRKQFIAAEGVTVSDDYVDTISAIVRNKHKFSKYVLENDYYATVFGKK